MNRVAEFYETKRTEELTADAYQQGVADGREQVFNERQERREYWAAYGFIAALALAGTLRFFELVNY